MPLALRPDLERPRRNSSRAFVSLEVAPYTDVAAVEGCLDSSCARTPARHVEQ